MKKSPKKPNAWVLFSILPFMAALLWLDGDLRIPVAVHQILEIGIVLLAFGLMALWVHANQAALIEEDAGRRLRVQFDEGDSFAARPEDAHLPLFANFQVPVRKMRVEDWEPTTRS